MKIVILGGGFGGVYTAKFLSKYLSNRKDIEIVLVNNKNYFLFAPLLHELATGNINIENLIVPLRKLSSNIKIIVDKVERINLEKKVVELSHSKLEYDYLVIALGSKTNFYNIQGAENHSLTLKSLDDALKLRNHFVEMFEKAEIFCQEELLNFVIVGGGATGVELACEMSDYFYKTFSKFYSKDLIDKTKIFLIEKGSELIPAFPSSLRKIALEILKKKKVEVILNKGVIAVGQDFIKLDDGNLIKTKTVIWTAGVINNLPEIIGNIEKDRVGRLLLNEYLQVKNYENVFALGDCACFMQGEKLLPQLAQVATKQANGVAQNILNLIQNKPLKRFTYHHSGDLISFGRWYAGGYIQGFVLKGKIAWFLWRAVYLSKIPSWENKIKTAIDWFRDLFFLRNISEI